MSKLRLYFTIFYVPQPRKLVFPLQLRVKQCCIFRYRGIQCRNWTPHAHYSLTVERNLFLILLLPTSSSYSVSTDYYTRPIKSKWPGLVANLRPLRTTSAANNYNKYYIRFQCTHKNSYPHHSHIKQNMCECTQFGTLRDSRQCSQDWSRLGFVSALSRLCLSYVSTTPWLRSPASIVARHAITLIVRLGT